MSTTNFNFTHTPQYPITEENILQVPYHLCSQYQPPNIPYVNARIVYPLNNPNVIRDYTFQQTLRNIYQYRNSDKIHVMFDPYEVFGIYPWAKSIAVGDRGSIIDLNHMKRIPCHKLGSGYMGTLLIHINSPYISDGTYLTHRLIAETFVPNPVPNIYSMVNHKNSCKTDNYSWNLEWINNSLNIRHNIQQVGIRDSNEYGSQTKRKIIQMLAQKYTTMEIALSIGYVGDLLLFTKLISKVRTGQRWTNFVEEMGYKVSDLAAPKYEGDVRIRDMNARQELTKLQQISANGKVQQGVKY